MWKKFSEIENSYQEKTLSIIREIVNKNVKWVVLPKVDGSNGSYIISKNDIKIARRSAVITDGSNFDCMLDNLEKYRTRFQCALKEVQSMYPSNNIESIIIFGENFGGSYNHPDVNKVPGSKKIQGRIQYCPHNDFIAFDIAIPTENGNQYMNWELATQVFESCNILFTPTLFVGTLDECLNYPNNEPDMIHKLFHLPPIENNITEGVVIKPLIEHQFGNGQRVILKNKNDKFSEKMKSNKIKVVKEINMSDTENEAREAILEFITINRFHNVLSHIGEVSKKDFGNVLKEYNLDILKDFEKEFNFNLTNEETKRLQKFVNNEASKIMRSEFFKHTID